MKKKILIVEDDAIAVLYLIDLLKGENIIIGTANHADDAVVKAKELNPDIILMDINIFGKKTGIDAIKEIQKFKLIDHIYITGYNETAIVTLAKETNPKNILSKPIDEMELLKSI